MRKKTILSIGALTLAMGLGITALTAGNALSLPFSNAVPTADEEVTAAPLVFKGATPASGSVLESWRGVKNLSFDFTDDAPANFGGIKVLSESGVAVEVYCSTSEGSFPAEPAYTVPVSDTNAVKVDGSYTNRLNVSLPQGMTMVDDATTYYKVVIPAGAVEELASTSVTPEEGEEVPVAQKNDEVSVVYTVVKGMPFTTTPGSGATVAMLGGGLDKASINFEEGAVVSVAAGAKAELFLVDNGQSTETLVGTYAVAANGNKAELTLALEADQAVAVTTNASKYKIVVPAGAVTVDGVANAEIVVSNIAVVLMNYTSFELVDAPEFGSEVTPNDISKVVYLMLPDGLKPVNNNGLYLYLYPASGSYVAQYKGVYNDKANFVEFTMAATTASNPGRNNPQYWFDGQYYFGITMSQYTETASGTKNSAINFPAFTLVDGLKGNPVVGVNGNIDATLYENGKKLEPNPIAKLVGQAALDAIPEETGIAAWRLTFLNACKPNVDNTTATIRLMKEGVAEPLFTQGMIETINLQHVWKNGNAPRPSKYYTTTTDQWAKQAASATATAATWTIWYNLSDEVWSYTTSTNANMTMCTPEILKTPGKYHLLVDEGYFVDANGVLSDAVDLQFCIVGPIEYTVSPESGSKLGAIDELTFTYPEGATVAVKGTPVIEARQNNLFGDKALGTFTATAEGNVVTLKAAEPITTPIKDGYKVIVPAGAWDITYNGETQANQATDVAYTVEIMPGTVTPATDAAVKYNELSTIEYKGNNDINGSTIKAALYQVVPGDEEGTTKRVLFADYSATIDQITVDGSTYPGKAKDLTFTTSADFSEMESGKYEFVIAANTLNYGTAGYNTEEYVYTYDVIGAPAKYSKYFMLAEPSAPEVYLGQTYGKKGACYWDLLADDFANLQKNNANFSVFSKATAELYRDGELLISSTLNVISTYIAGEWEIDFSDADDFKAVGADAFKVPGKYTLKLTEGYFKDKSTGELLAGCEYSFTLLEDPAVDFTYTLAPATDEVVESLSEVTLSFPNCSLLQWKDGVVATLSNADGSVKVDCTSAKYTEDYKGMILTFGDDNTAWVSGDYTLTVPAGVICVDGINWDEISAGNFEGLTATYSLNYVATEKPKLQEYLQLYLPNEVDCDRISTKNDLSEYGMGIVGLVLGGGVQRGEGSDFITMAYQAEGAEPEVLSALNPMNEAAVIILGAVGSADYDPNNFQTANMMYLTFAVQGEVGSDEDVPWNDPEANAPYRRTGKYILTIPDGAFTLDGQKMEGVTIVYNYSDGSTVFTSDKYTLDPPEGNFQDPTDFFNPGISVDFAAEGVKFVDYYKKGGGSLIGPNGESYLAQTAKYGAGGGGNTTILIYRFGTSTTEWPNGQYTFSIAPNEVGFNIRWPEEAEECTFPGLTATYIVGTDSVALIGIAPADSYNVYTVDGKAVKLNAAPEEMLDLEGGLYIINGQKVKVVK